MTKRRPRPRQRRRRIRFVPLIEGMNHPIYKPNQTYSFIIPPGITIDDALGSYIDSIVWTFPGHPEDLVRWSFRMD
jgi:hypothetical protein